MTNEILSDLETKLDYNYDDLLRLGFTELQIKLLYRGLTRLRVGKRKGTQ